MFLIKIVFWYICIVVLMIYKDIEMIKLKIWKYYYIDKMYIEIRLFYFVVFLFCLELIEKGVLLVKLLWEEVNNG